MTNGKKATNYKDNFDYLAVVHDKHIWFIHTDNITSNRYISMDNKDTFLLGT